MINDAPRAYEPPEGVHLYGTTEALIIEDPRWQAPNGVAGDLRGWDIADGFLLGEPSMPGGSSWWRISVHERQVYAVLRRYPGAATFTFNGPVWLLDTVPEPLDPSVEGATIRTIARELEQLRDQPDSLLLAVHQIRALFSVVRAAVDEVARRRYEDI